MSILYLEYSISQYIRLLYFDMLRFNQTEFDSVWLNLTKAVWMNSVWFNLPFGFCEMESDGIRRQFSNLKSHIWYFSKVSPTLIFYGKFSGNLTFEKYQKCHFKSQVALLKSQIVHWIFHIRWVSGWLSRNFSNVSPMLIFPFGTCSGNLISQTQQAIRCNFSHANLLLKIL